MPRLIAAVCSIVALLPVSVFAQVETLTVLSAEEEAQSRRMLHSYLIAKAQEHFDARRKRVDALKTPQDIEKRRGELRAAFIESIGGLPERTPLKAEVVGTIPADRFRIEKIIFESRPGHHVTANLYLPTGKGPFPGVIMPIGHSVNGKAADYIQRGSTLLARNGIAVLAYDPIGQGERRQVLDALGKSLIPSSTGEHTMIGVGAILVGRNTASYRIWDGMRALDYLASRPEIDPKRLGCTGCSGGGTETSYLMALDDRIVAAAPSCYITSLERLFATIGPQDAEQNITGQVAFGMEHADYVTMHAPRPTLICAASRDFFDIQGTWTSFREAKRIYSLLGYGERVDLFESDSTHGFPRPQREATLRWMRRWLAQDDTPLVEEERPILKDETLWCTRSGQVIEDRKGRSVFDLNVELANSFKAQRDLAKEKPAPEILRREVSRLIGLKSPAPAAMVREMGILKRDGYEIRKLTFSTELGITIPALLFVKGADDRAPLLIAVHGRGKSVDAGVGGRYEQLLKAGQRVLAIDLRGMGETSPTVVAANAKPAPFGADSKEAFLALHLNRPLLGQRVFDLQAVIGAMVKNGNKSIQLLGIGNAGPIALHVAALDERVERLTLIESIRSWADVVETPISSDQLTNVVPGALKVYDLPDLQRLVAPRPIDIEQPVDATGRVLEAKQ